MLCGGRVFTSARLIHAVVLQDSTVRGERTDATLFTTFAPERDPTYVSGLNANRIVRECLVGIAMRKKGLTGPHYLSPKTVNDGRD